MLKQKQMYLYQQLLTYTIDIDARIRSSRSLRKIRKNVKFEDIFHEHYKFSILVTFHVEVKVTRQ
jgi:hypothetical protein